MGLVAPAHITVELREEPQAERVVRRFRLTTAIGPESIELRRPVQWPPSRPLFVRFRLPGTERLIECRATTAGDEEGACRTLELWDLGDEERALILAYVVNRLGLD